MTSQIKDLEDKAKRGGAYPVVDDQGKEVKNAKGEPISTTYNKNAFKSGVPERAVPWATTAKLADTSMIELTYADKACDHSDLPAIATSLLSARFPSPETVCVPTLIRGGTMNHARKRRKRAF